MHSRGSETPGRAATLRSWAEPLALTGCYRSSAMELYDRGVHRTDRATGYWLAPNAAIASAWYQRAAVAEQPNALAHMAEREEALADSGRGPTHGRAHLLAAFRYYAAAAEQARREDWPDPAWSRWRYQRASLARRLADQGLMARTAAIYDAIAER